MKTIFIKWLCAGLVVTGWAWTLPCRAQSAIGQLETITEQTINRPTSSSLPMMHSGSGTDASALAALGAGMMVLQMLDSMDSSQKTSQAERAMQEAEQQRLLEAQRQQRLISAERLRSFWDGADIRMAADLDGVLDPDFPWMCNYVGMSSLKAFMILRCIGLVSVYRFP